MFNSNPAFSDKIVEDLNDFERTERMSIKGTIIKTLFLLICAIVPFAAIWSQVDKGFIDKATLYAGGGALVAFILAIVIMSRPNTAKFLSPVYAFGEGLFLGAISAVLNTQFQGIVPQAVALTILCLLSMLFLYSSKIIRNTPKFQKVIFISMLAIAGIYLINFVGFFFNFTIPMVYSSDSWGIGFSILIVIVSSLTFIINFDTIEKAVVYCYPKNSEWYFAFGLMVNLVWLYLEILRLLSKITER